jgi:methyltransferase (TIGR00027 family)
MPDGGIAPAVELGGSNVVKEKPAAKRIHTATSRTAEWTCMSRAASSFEVDPHYRSGDFIAAQLIPSPILVLLRTRIGRIVFRRWLAAKGVYEYVIARTRYIDAAFQKALEDRFEQIVLFGAGFDTRTIRFQSALQSTQVFELDVPITQAAKIDRYRQRGLTVPPNLKFVAIDFDKESIEEKLRQFGFREKERSLFIFEGVLMYLLPASVDSTFRMLGNLAGQGSRVVFDYVRASVLRGSGTVYGEAGVTRAVNKVNEQWQFGLEPDHVESFLSSYGFRMNDHRNAGGLEQLYFTDSTGMIVSHINGTHGIVTAERS